MADDIAKETRSLGQFDGEGFGIGGKVGGQREIHESIEKIVEFALFFEWRRRSQCVEHKGLTRTDLCDLLAFSVKTKLEKVGEDEIWKHLAIAFKLLGTLEPIQAFFCRIFRLDIADDLTLAVPEAEVRVATIRWLGKRGDIYIWAVGGGGEFLKHLLQRRIETLLRRIAMRR